MKVWRKWKSKQSASLQNLIRKIPCLIIYELKESLPKMQVMRMLFLRRVPDIWEIIILEHCVIIQSMYGF